jgi:quinohemoprotein amine dehydrogenase
MPRLRFALLAGVAAFALVTGAADAQRGGAAPPGRGGGPRDTTTGYKIGNPLVIQYCGDCHVRDTNTSLIPRLSFMRKTPEGWETSVRRMASLNGVRIDPPTARAIVKFLSDSLGLAPGEVKPAQFEAERRMIDFTYSASAPTENTCRACHSIGRVMLQRRTREEWTLLVTTHRGLYPTSEGQGLGSGAAAPPPGEGRGGPPAIEQALTHLATAFPLRTPEWTAWSATMRPARLEGTWSLAGTEPGRGAFFGRMTITRGATPDEFTTRTTYRYASGGAAVVREGSTMVFTGFQWRGRSRLSGRGASDSGLREVMFVEPGWQQMNGRWFTGAYDELGMDVMLTRVTANPVIAGIVPRALRTRGTHDVTVFGVNFPRAIDAADIDFGPGVHVQRVVRITPDSVSVQVRVDSAARAGVRDLFLAGASLRSAAVVYDKVSRIAVTPLAGMARVGGVVFPKQLQQFDAVGYHVGPDGKPGTDDDIDVGPVPVTWSVEEYVATYDDDDLKWVGALDRNGLFTPALDGPNPQRKGNRNNIGDLGIVATHQPADRTGAPLKARAHLVVTVPLYMRWAPLRTSP